MNFSMDSVLLRRTPRETGIVKLKGLDRNEGQFLSCSDDPHFCLVIIWLKFVLCHPFFFFLCSNNSQMWMFSGNALLTS